MISGFQVEDNRTWMSLELTLGGRQPNPCLPGRVLLCPIEKGRLYILLVNRKYEITQNKYF